MSRSVTVTPKQPTDASLAAHIDVAAAHVREEAVARVDAEALAMLTRLRGQTQLHHPRTRPSMRLMLISPPNNSVCTTSAAGAGGGCGFMATSRPTSRRRRRRRPRRLVCAAAKTCTRAGGGRWRAPKGTTATFFQKSVSRSSLGGVFSLLFLFFGFLYLFLDALPNTSNLRVLK